MIRVVELKRNAPPRDLTGDILTEEEFKSWRSAWKYYEDDCLHDRRCSKTRVQKYGRNSGQIQHWGEYPELRDCSECRGLVSKRLEEEI